MAYKVGTFSIELNTYASLQGSEIVDLFLQNIYCQIFSFEKHRGIQSTIKSPEGLVHTYIALLEYIYELFAFLFASK